MKKERDIKNNNGSYDWLFSDREHQDGETYDIHFLLNIHTGEVKKVIQKRIEVVEESDTRIVEG